MGVTIIKMCGEVGMTIALKNRIEICHHLVKDTARDPHFRSGRMDFHLEKAMLIELILVCLQDNEYRIQVIVLAT